MKILLVTGILICAVIVSTFAIEWKMGEGSHVITQLPANVKEKMKLKYETITLGYMEKKVRLTGKVTVKKGSRYESVFTVHRKDKKFISAGQEITAETPLIPGKVLKGKVVTVTKQEGATKRRVYEAKVTFDANGSELKSGTILNGKVDYKTPEKVVAVPDGAVHVILHRRCVFVCTGKDGKYELREIESGFKGNGYTQITKGLKGGEQIVTDGSFHLRAELLKPESDFGGHGHAH